MGWLVVGMLLGGPVGVGTIVVAWSIGPAVARGHRFVDGLVGSSRLRVSASIPRADRDVLVGSAGRSARS